MSRIYAVSVVLNVKHGDYSHVRQIPTFYLYSDVQGIMDETHAANIARGMWEGLPNVTDVHVAACETSNAAHA
jgi:hypothetical protein